MTRTRLRAVGWTAAVSAIAATLLVPATASTTPTPVRPDDATVGPLVAGTASYVDGTYAWTDYAYDDRGADSDGSLGGDATYPEGMSPDNVADLIQLQLRPAKAGLDITAVLETLTSASRPLVGVAFDAPGGAPVTATLPGSWSAATLGMNRLFTLGRGGGAEYAATATGTWTQLRRFPVALDPKRNTVSATVPFALPASGLLRSVALVGYEDSGRSWLSGEAPVHDLAFVDDGWVTRNYLEGVALDATGFITGDSAYWQDGLQADILAGESDPAPAVGRIDLGLLRSGRTSLAELEGPGFATFLYRSALRLGEGVQGSGNSAVYAGPYQPYLVRLPKNPRPGLPLVVYLHGSSQTHISPVNTAHYDPESAVPGLGLPDKVFELDAVVVWPLGRGPQQWYRDASEQDALDVTDDVLDRLALDADRVMLAGMSMGGMGTFRLGQLHPDRWSLLYSDVGTDQVDLLVNLTNVPLRFHNGVLDPLVNYEDAEQARARADAAGTVDYRSWILTKGSHQPAVRLAECVYLDAFKRTRTVDPARVRYTVDPTMFRSDPKTGLRLVYDGAYWVDGMKPAGKSRGSVDLTTSALGTALKAGETTSANHQNTTAGRDFCGPNPQAQGADSWSEQSRAVAEVARPARPVLAGTLRGLSAVTVDAATAGLTRFRAASLTLDADRPVTLTVTGLAVGSRLTIGRTAVVADRKGTATLSLGRGTSRIRLQSS